MLRFLAFLAVFLHHAIPLTTRGWIQNRSQEVGLLFATAARAGAFGVDLFFLLSAYLITTLLLREHQQRGGIGVLSFYARRALRIWPLYYVFLLLTVWVVPFLLPNDRLQPPYLAAFCLFVGNWVCASRGYPNSVAVLLWSVSIEEQFYLTWPILLSWTGARRLVSISAGLLVLATGVRFWMANQHLAHPGVWCNTFAHLDPIAVGAILAVRFGASEPRIGGLARGSLFVAGGIAWFMAAARRGSLAGWASLWSYPVATLGSAAMLVAMLGAFPEGHRWPGFGAVTHLGRVSYGLYVFHALAIALVVAWGGLGPLEMPAAFGLTVALALVSYRWLESPFLRLKERFAAVPSGRPL